MKEKGVSRVCTKSTFRDDARFRQEETWAQRCEQLNSTKKK